MPTYQFSSDYYRALARIILDLRYGKELKKVATDFPKVKDIIQNGGFGLTNTEISAIISLLPNLPGNTGDIIKEINGLPLNPIVNEEDNQLQAELKDKGMHILFNRLSAASYVQVKPVDVVV